MLFNLRSNVSKKDIILILLVFAAALLARGLYLRQYSLTRAYPFLPYSDSYFYYLRALGVTSGDFLNWKIFISWPLYSYLLAFLLKLGHNSLALVYIFQNILGALQCVLVYLIGRALCGRFAGFLAALFCAFYGILVFYDNLLIYTSAALFLNSLFFLFVLRIFKDDLRPWRLFIAGILLGVCTAMQAGVAVFGLMALLWISWNRGNDLPHRFRMCLFSVCGFALVITVLAGVNYASDKNMVILSRNTGFNFYLGNNPQATGSYYTPALFTPNQEALYNEARGAAEMDRGGPLSASEVSGYWFAKSFGFIIGEPLSYIRLIGRKIALTFFSRDTPCDTEYSFSSGIFPLSWRFTRVLGFIIPLVLMGFFLARGLGKKVILLYLAVLGFAINTVAFFVISKNRIMMFPFLAVFAGISLYRLWVWLKGREYLKSLIFIMVFAVLYFYCGHFISFGNNLSLKTSAALKHFQNGLDCIEKADYDCALRELNSARDSDPHNPRIMFSLGTVYYELRNYEKAQEQFMRALEATPFYTNAYYNLGYMYNRLGRYQEAIAVLKKGLSYIRGDAGLYYELACAYEGLGELAQAKSSLVSALATVRRWQPERVIIETKLKEIENGQGGDISGGADGGR
jgi:tetratricopeptide (TPR) repeat protein